MAKKLLTVLLVLVSFAALGQRTKEEKMVSKITGAWVFADGKIKGNQFGNIELKSWHTDSIFLYPDRTVEFLSHGSGKKVRRNKGQWDIGESGKTLVINNRTATPPYKEPLENVELPIQMLSRNRLIIAYPVVFQVQKSSVENKMPSPQEEKTAVIEYRRLK